VRRSHGLEPTGRALDLAPRIEALIQALDETVGGEPPFDPAVSRRRFRLGAADPIPSVIGPPLVALLRREAPLAMFSIRPTFLDPALRAVRRGELDLALGAFGYIPETLSASVLYEDRYCVVARRGHPRIFGGRVDRTTYATAGHVYVGNPDVVMVDQGNVEREAMDGAYGAVPGPDQVRTHAYVSGWETAMLIVATTDALADCPESLARRHAARLGLDVLEPPGRPFRFTVQAVRRAGVADAGLDWFMGRLAAALAM
jgi:DNA-binding transcriptional LysR family regulator